MAGTLVKKVSLRITADDGDTESKLSKISAKADELARKHPDLKVRVDSAAASAKLAVLRRELKDTSNQADDTRGRFGALGQAMNIFATGGLGGGISQMTMFQKGMLGLNIATGLGEPLVAGLTVAVGGLSSGLVSAGLGAGVFGLAAEGVVKKVEAADTAGKKLTGSLGRLQSGLKTAKDEWSGFVRAAAPGVSSVIAQGLGLIPKALSLMKPFLAPVEHALHGIISEVSTGLDSSGFKSFIDMMAKESGPMLSDLGKAIINIAKGLGGILKTFMPVSHGLMHGLDDITAKFAHWGQTLGSHSGFQSLMKMFKSETPLAVSALKQLGGIIGTVVKQMTGMSTFSNSKTLLQLALPVLKFVNALLKAHPQLVSLALYLKLAADGGKKLQTAFNGLQGGMGVLKGGVTAAKHMKDGFSDAETAASDASGMWGTFGGKLSKATNAVKEFGIGSKIARLATKAWSIVQAGFNIIMDANPIGLIVIAIAGLVVGIVELWKHSAGFRNFWKGAWRDIKQWASDAGHFLGSVFKDITKSITKQWDMIKHATSDVWHFITGLIRDQVKIVQGVLSWFGRLPGLFRGWWDDAVGAVEGAAGRLFSFVRSIPHKILSALGNVGSMLWNAGIKIVQGLIGGISSMIGSVGRAISGIAGEITSHLPFSPAKKGPLAGAGDPRLAGQRIGRYVALGIGDSLDGVIAASARLAHAAGVGGTMTGARSAAAGGWDGVVRLKVDAGGGEAEQFLALMLRKYVRTVGGGGPDSVQRTLGRTT